MIWGKKEVWQKSQASFSENRKNWAGGRTRTESDKRFRLRLAS